MALIAVATGAGLIHRFFSLYWALGGDWLLDTLGQQLVALFDGRRGLLLPVAIVKIVCALAPWGLAFPIRRGRPLLRLGCWAGAVVLVAWGGANTVIGNLVLAGIVRPAGGYDRSGMIGHAWLWDPLFLTWGAALIAALLLTGRARGPGRQGG